MGVCVVIKDSIRTCNDLRALISLSHSVEDRNGRMGKAEGDEERACQ